MSVNWAVLHREDQSVMGSCQRKDASKISLQCAVHRPYCEQFAVLPLLREEQRLESDINRCWADELRMMRR